MRRSNAPTIWLRVGVILLVVQSLVLGMSIRYDVEPTGWKIEIQLRWQFEKDHGRSSIKDRLHIPRRSMFGGSSDPDYEQEGLRTPI